MLRSLLTLVLGAFLVTSCSDICNDASLERSNDEEVIPVAVPGYVIKDVYFAFDSSTLTPVAKSTLQEAANWLKANSSRVVVVEGHCDERGTVEYNLVLGEKRARAAYDYLVGLGVSANQMSTISYGEEFPLDPAHNESAWAKNRRVHFAIK